MSSFLFSLRFFSRYTYIRVTTRTWVLIYNGNVNYVFMGIGNVCLEVFYKNTIYVGRYS